MSKPNVRDFYEDLGHENWTHDEFTDNHFRNIRGYMARVNLDFTEGTVDNHTVKYATMVIDQVSSLIPDLLDIIEREGK